MDYGHYYRQTTVNTIDGLYLRPLMNYNQDYKGTVANTTLKTID